MASSENKIQLSSGQSVSAEYVDRISRLILAFCEGASIVIPHDQSLHGKLQDLSKVIEKTLNEKNHAGLGLEIKELFERKKMEEEFRILEKEGLVNVVRELTLVIGEFAEPAGQVDQDLESFIEDIQNTDNLLDIRELKDKLLTRTREAQKNIQSARQELEVAKKTCDTLQRRLEETEARVIIDPLTRVLNRSAYDMKVDQVISEFNRFKEPSTLAVVDIDNFKEVNDNHGHQCGDNALTSIAGNIKECIRDSDVVFRYGGEEFVVVFNKTDLKGANVIAEKIRMRVESIRTHLVNDLYADKDKRIQITVSIGMAEVKEGDDSKSLFDRADKALYKAKQEGRNRVVLAE